MPASSIYAPLQESEFNNSEFLRPRIHFTPQRNWMNDPNGCVFFNGQYHLYFQYHPNSVNWGPMHWGHAVSTNLLNWEEREVALNPGDFGMAFSGTALADEGNLSGFFPDDSGLLALYTGHVSLGEDHLQQQYLAISTDGNIWKPVSGNPVIPNPGIKDFRDPRFFWYEPEGVWITLLAAEKEVIFYRSDDLLNWKESGRFGMGLGNPCNVWECPDMFCLDRPDRPGEIIWVLSVSYMGNKVPDASPVQYFLGHFDGYTFHCLYNNQTSISVDYGNDFYAPQCWSNMPPGDNRKIWIAWAGNWLYASDVPTGQWRGTMSLPRELNLINVSNQIEIRQQPVQELDMLPKLPWTPTTEPCVHLLEWKLTRADTGDAVMKFLFNDSGELIIHWIGSKKVLLLDRLGIGNAFHKMYDNPSVILPNGEKVDMRIILDGCMLEIYAQNGRRTFSSLIFPCGSLKSIHTKCSISVCEDFFEHNMVYI